MYCRAFPLIAAVMIVGVGIPGCGSGVETYPVTVKVSFPDGQAPEGATVTFHSIPDPDAEDIESRSAIGKIGADGTAQMTTRAPGDGAVAGRHRVTVTPSSLPGRPGEPNAAPGPGSQIHPRFQRADTSGLEVTVSPDGDNEIPIEIDRR